MSFSYSHTTHTHSRSRNNSQSSEGGNRSRNNSGSEDGNVKSRSRKNSHNDGDLHHHINKTRSRNNSQCDDKPPLSPSHSTKLNRSRHNSHTDKCEKFSASRTSSHSSEPDSCSNNISGIDNKACDYNNTNQINDQKTVSTSAEEHTSASHSILSSSLNQDQDSQPQNSHHSNSHNEHIFVENELKFNNRIMESAGTAEKKIIVLAVDGGAHSELAFKFYKDNVDRPGYYLHVVHHCDVWRHYLPEEGGPSENHYQEIQAKAKGVIDEVEIKYKKLIEEFKVNGEVCILHGKDPWHDIVKHQEDCEAVMIVMGTRGGGALARTFRGSVSDSVVHHAKVPVLVCCHPKNI